MKKLSRIFIGGVIVLLTVGCGANKPLTSSVAQQSFPIPLQPPTMTPLPSATPTSVAINLAPPAIISPAPIIFKASLLVALPQNIPFLGVPVGSSAQICVQVTNTGLGQASQLSQTIGAPFTVSNSAISNCAPLNACGSTLDANKSCALGVQYVPIQPGLFLQNLRVNYFDGISANNAAVPIQGSAVSPGNLSLTQISGGFQSARVGSSSYGCVQVLNNGGGVVQSIAASLNAPFYIDPNGLQTCNGSGTNTCYAGSSVASGGSCVIGIRFAPTALDSLTQPILVSYSNTVSPRSVSLDLAGSGNYPYIAGNYSDQSGDTIVVNQDSNNNLSYLVTTPRGGLQSPVSGTFNSLNQISGWTYTGNIISASEIDWSQGSVWTKH